jgi:hypothetical protein
MIASTHTHLHQLLAAEWKHARNVRRTAARICSEPLARRALVWAARLANDRYVQHSRWIAS